MEFKKEISLSWTQSSPEHANRGLDRLLRNEPLSPIQIDSLRTAVLEWARMVYRDRSSEEIKQWLKDTTQADRILVESKTKETETPDSRTLKTMSRSKDNLRVIDQGVQTANKDCQIAKAYVTRNGIGDDMNYLWWSFVPKTPEFESSTQFVLSDMKYSYPTPQNFWDPSHFQIGPSCHLDVFREVWDEDRWIHTHLQELMEERYGKPGQNPVAVRQIKRRKSKLKKTLKYQLMDMHQNHELIRGWTWKQAHTFGQLDVFAGGGKEEAILLSLVGSEHYSRAKNEAVAKLIQNMESSLHHVFTFFIKGPDSKGTEMIWGMVYILTR